MLRKIKSVLLLCLMAGAAMSVNGAWHSIHRGRAAALPAELTVRFAGREDAAYILRDLGGYVAVYEGRKARDPAEVTAIETACLRASDRRLLKEGIPAADSRELLGLLEDLGS